jgi:hypothetical protein
VTGDFEAFVAHLTEDGIGFCMSGAHVSLQTGEDENEINKFIEFKVSYSLVDMNPLPHSLQMA